MTIKWLSPGGARIGSVGSRWRRLVAAATTSDRSLDRWDGWQVDAGRRREVDDLAAMRGRFPGRR